MCQARVLTGRVLLLTAILIGPAEGQPEAPTGYALPPATTTLHLSATGAAQVSPDEGSVSARAKPGVRWRAWV